jgi:hypothetical protein
MQWLGVLGLAVLVGFGFFAMRQGSKVKPSGNNPDRESISSEHAGGPSGGGASGGGGSD